MKKLYNNYCIPDIERVDTCFHTGNYISGIIDEENVLGILQQFHSRTNYLLSDFSMLLSDVMRDLHNSYCMNMYNSELLNFNKSYMDKICKTHRTHNYIINNISCSVELLLCRKNCTLYTFPCKYT